ncbi:glycerol-3-phosphate dehydrogenase SDP6, mitochondrial-like [Acanthopagrus latus]|uniref:glycerol-3-phosphate dehydrogenase SDP6, mitochondrial-like n=1 Tax=Acanthopagrus latus TaxID=8177 RepID=UPI00187D01CC|nr:glycerol-3-phosphate dehydrogenase SDP6, mitochondrial-like [Acanthopagrus latus]
MGSAVTRRGGLFAFYSLAQPAVYKRKTDLKTALVQGDDFSSGTSSRSTKLIHGGVRYLQKAIMKLDYKQVVFSLGALFFYLYEHTRVLEEDGGDVTAMCNGCPAKDQCLRWCFNIITG